MKTIYLVLGAIGSGKSVISDFLLSFEQLQGSEYVGADMYKNKFFNYSVSKDKRGYRCADELVFNRIEQLCKLDSDFILELCPTNKNKIDKIIDLTKKYKYKITTFYIGVDDVAKNLERCIHREQWGWDHVEERKIKKRFIDAQRGGVKLFYMSSIIYFVDNSYEIPRIIAKYWEGKYCIYESNCVWFNKIKTNINN